MKIRYHIPEDDALIISQALAYFMATHTGTINEKTRVALRNFYPKKGFYNEWQLSKKFIRVAGLKTLLGTRLYQIISYLFKL